MVNVFIRFGCVVMSVADQGLEFYHLSQGCLWRYFVIGLAMSNISTPSTVRPLHRSALVVMVGALGVGIATFVASGVYFSAFIHDGRSFLGVAQAFILCFGLGAGVYLPASVLFFMARHIRTYGPKPSIGWAVLVIGLPLFMCGAIGVFYTSLKLISGLFFAIGLLLLVWGGAILARKRRL